jgi:hypothetical protein
MSIRLTPTTVSVGLGDALGESADGLDVADGTAGAEADGIAAGDPTAHAASDRAAITNATTTFQCPLRGRGSHMAAPRCEPAKPEAVRLDVRRGRVRPAPSLGRLVRSSGQSIAAWLPSRDSLKTKRPHRVLAASVCIDHVDRAVVEPKEGDLGAVW